MIEITWSSCINRCNYGMTSSTDWVSVVGAIVVIWNIYWFIICPDPAAFFILVWGRKCWLEIPNNCSRGNAEALTNGCFQANDDDDESHVLILLGVQLQAMIKLDFSLGWFKWLSFRDTLWLCGHPTKRCKIFSLRGSAYLERNNLTQQIDKISSDGGIEERNASKKNRLSLDLSNHHLCYYCKGMERGNHCLSWISHSSKYLLKTSVWPPESQQYHLGDSEMWQWNHRAQVIPLDWKLWANYWRNFDAQTLANRKTLLKCKNFAKALNNRGNYCLHVSD